MASEAFDDVFCVACADVDFGVFEADFEIVAWVGPDRVAVGKGCGVGGGAQKEDGEKGREHVGKLECVVRLC